MARSRLEYWACQYWACPGTVRHVVGNTAYQARQSRAYFVRAPGRGLKSTPMFPASLARAGTCMMIWQLAVRPRRAWPPEKWPDLRAPSLSKGTVARQTRRKKSCQTQKKKVLGFELRQVFRLAIDPVHSFGVSKWRLLGRGCRHVSGKEVLTLATHCLGTLCEVLWPICPCPSPALRSSPPLAIGT